MENRTPETILSRVVAALISQGADAVLEYPGYIAIYPEGKEAQHYATGIANPTWTIDRLDHEGSDIQPSIDTELATTENDAPKIARAIIRAIQEDQE